MLEEPSQTSREGVKFMCVLSGLVCGLLAFDAAVQGNPVNLKPETLDSEH